MKLKSLKDTDINGKTILYRSPYDIGVKEMENGSFVIKDDSRIRATLDTLRYLIENNCKIVILTWVKRPKGIEDKLRTKPHARALSDLLGTEVQYVDDCIGQKVRQKIDNLKPGQLIMLENVRFYAEEDADDDEFAKKLAQNGEFVVFDGFPQAHRSHASTTGILRHLDGAAGFYFEREVQELEKLMENPESPFTLIIGGAKVSDKVDAVNNLIDKTQHVLIGGGTANVFLKARGVRIGSSFVEDDFVDENRKEKKDWVEYAKEIMSKNPDKIVIPIDLVVSNGKETKIVSVEAGVAPEWRALDIGPKTIEEFKKIIDNSNTVFWNGPMGVFEEDGFEGGTKAVAQAMAETQGTTIVGGGDTVEAALKFADTSKITHLSLAGGASLEFLAGKKLPALEMLKRL